MAKQVEMDSKCLQRAGFLEVMRQGPRTTLCRTHYLRREEIYTKRYSFTRHPLPRKISCPPKSVLLKIIIDNYSKTDFGGIFTAR